MEKGAWGDGDKLEKGEKGPGLGNVGEVLVSPLGMCPCNCVTTTYDMGVVPPGW